MAKHIKQIAIYTWCWRSGIFEWQDSYNDTSSRENWRDCGNEVRKTKSKKRCNLPCITHKNTWKASLRKHPTHRRLNFICKWATKHNWEGRGIIISKKVKLLVIIVSIIIILSLSTGAIYLYSTRCKPIVNQYQRMSGVIWQKKIWASFICRYYTA